MLKLRVSGKRKALVAKMLTNEYVQRLAFLKPACVSLLRVPCCPHRSQRKVTRQVKDINSPCIPLSYSYLLSLPSALSTLYLLLKSKH